MATQSEIESLIFLLDDPDPEVQSGVQNRFRQLGERAVPLLDQYRTDIRDKQEREMVDDILHSITFSALYEDFNDLLKEGIDSRESLEKAVFLLARFGNPTLRIEDYMRKLDRFTAEVEHEVLSRPEESHRMHSLLKFIFRELRFRGDNKDYHNPENAFMDRVIDHRKGLPISLSLIVMFISRRLRLPFYGVNMPIHFMLIFEGSTREVLIDPFDGGTVVTYDQCHYFLKKNGIKPRPEHMRRAPEHEILARSIRNLMHSYIRLEKEERANNLQSLLNLVELRGG